MKTGEIESERNANYSRGTEMGRGRRATAAAPTDADWTDRCDRTCIADKSKSPPPEAFREDIMPTSASDALGRKYMPPTIGRRMFTKTALAASTAKKPLEWCRPSATELQEGDFLRNVRTAIRAANRLARIRRFWGGKE